MLLLSFLNQSITNELVEHGIIIDDVFTPVLPLSMPSKNITLSNVNFRRFVYMIVKDDADLEFAFSFLIDNFDCCVCNI